MVDIWLGSCALPGGLTKAHSKGFLCEFQQNTLKDAMRSTVALVVFVQMNGQKLKMDLIQSL